MQGDQPQGMDEAPSDRTKRLYARRHRERGDDILRGGRRRAVLRHETSHVMGAGETLPGYK
jgi:hypothetical protein